MADLSNVPTSELLKHLSDNELKSIAGIDTATTIDAPGPIDSSAMVSGMETSPWEVGNMPTKEESYPVVRSAAQMSIGTPAWLGGSPIAGGAASALAGAGVDVLYGKVPNSEQVGTDAVLGMAIPGASITALRGARKLAGKGAMALYEGALKSFPSLTEAERTGRVMTGLRDKILPVGKNSLDLLRGFADRMNAVVETNLLAKEMQGKYIATDKIKSAAADEISGIRSSNIFGNKSSAVADELISDLNQLPAYITPTKALEYRRDLNKKLTLYFNRKMSGTITAPESEATRVMARTRLAVNNGIYEIAPELKDLGKREADIINLSKSVERETARAGNRDILSIGALATGVGGELLAKTSPEHAKYGHVAATGAAGMLLYGILSRPNMKARVAFALAKAGRLNSASPTTLQMLGLSEQSASVLQPMVKALPYPRAMRERDWANDPVIKKVESYMDDMSALDPRKNMTIPDYETAWKKYSELAPHNTHIGDIIPESRRLPEVVDMSEKYFIASKPDPMSPGISIRGKAIVDSVELGQMSRSAGIKELTHMSNAARMYGNTSLADIYRKMAESLPR